MRSIQEKNYRNILKETFKLDCPNIIMDELRNKIDDIIIILLNETLDNTDRHKAAIDLILHLRCLTVTLWALGEPLGEIKRIYTTCLNTIKEFYKTDNQDLLIFYVSEDEIIKINNKLHTFVDDASRLPIEPKDSPSLLLYSVASSEEKDSRSRFGGYELKGLKSILKIISEYIKSKTKYI